MMNKKSTEKKMHLKILSGIMAVILWFAITTAEDPYITINEDRISVYFSSEAALSTKELILVNQKELPTPQIKIRGRRSDIRSVLGNITATVDLSDITGSGTYTRRISYDIPNSAVSIIDRKVSTYLLEIEDVLKKTVPVNLIQTGQDKNKEFLVQSIPAEKKISISGAKEDIEKITSATITVPVDTILADTTEHYPVTFTDSNKATVTPKYTVTTSLEKIPVTNTVFKRVTLPFALAESVALKDYQVVVKSFSPDKLEVGIPADTPTPDSIEIELEKELEVGQNQKISMKPILPEDFYVPAMPEELIMTADIEKLVIQSVTIPVTFENKPEKMQITLQTPTVTTLLKGPASQIAKARAIADLSGLGAGEHIVPVLIVAENTTPVSEDTVYASVKITQNN
ncbi:MAG: hypothetical protein E7397_04060 [Ruminococcaceae bacterium]|nr:hypothetical protein [Oscillospiraceae bacterium]